MRSDFELWGHKGVLVNRRLSFTTHFYIGLMLTTLEALSAIDVVALLCSPCREYRF